jgi:hypothetical protein
MIDRSWVEKFAKLCGLSPPSLRPSRKEGDSDVWHKEVSGLRAPIILRDVRGYPVGEKLAEADKAIDLFSPTDYLD